MVCTRAFVILLFTSFYMSEILQDKFFKISPLYKGKSTPKRRKSRKRRKDIAKNKRQCFLRKCSCILPPTGTQATLNKQEPAPVEEMDYLIINLTADSFCR